MRSVRLSMILLLTATLFQSSPVFSRVRGSGLSVTPTRIVFEKNKRAQELTIINNGNETSTYRIQIYQSRMSETGKQEKVSGKLTEPEVIAEKLIRYAPRQVRLKPGEQQTVRVMARIPGGLAEGEYKTGLNFQWVPEPGEPQINSTNSISSDISVKIEFSFGVAIPVIIRHGNLSSTGKISEAEVKSDQGPTLEFKIIRSGNSSLYGDLSIFSLSEDGIEQPVEIMRGVAIYVPNPFRIFTIKLPEDLLDKQGRKIKKLKIEYREREQAGAKLIAQIVLPVK